MIKIGVESKEELRKLIIEGYKVSDVTIGEYMSNFKVHGLTMEEVAEVYNEMKEEF